MEKNEKYLIRNTTRKQRKEIVLRSLGGEGCSGCSGCDGAGCGDAFEIYREYIEGKKELAEINRTFRGGTVS